MTKPLYLIRHGETTGPDIFQGSLDLPLSQRGHEQAREILPSIIAKQVYVSPRQRCLQTAQYLPSGTPTVVLTELAEIHFGAWEGLTWNEVQRLWPELATAKSADWLGVTPPDGEPWLELVNRTGRALAQIQLGQFPAAVIAHQMTNGALIHILSGHCVANFRQDYCDVLCVELGESNAGVPSRWP